MWSGCVCGTVDVAAGEYMYGACLMAVVLVGVLLVRERKQTGLSLVWIFFLSAVQQTEATHGLLPPREVGRNKAATTRSRMVEMKSRRGKTGERWRLKKQVGALLVHKPCQIPASKFMRLGVWSEGFLKVRSEKSVSHPSSPPFSRGAMSQSSTQTITHISAYPTVSQTPKDKLFLVAGPVHT